MSQEKNNLSNAFKDLEYVFQSGKANVLGHRYINNKRFEDALESTKDNLIDELREARSIEEEKEEIINNAQEEAQRMIDETEAYINSLDFVSEAKQIARELVEEAQDQANEKVQNAEGIAKNAIEYGENVKNKLIFQGYDFIEEQMKSALEGVEKSRTEIEKSYAEVTELMNGNNDEEDNRKIS